MALPDAYTCGRGAMDVVKQRRIVDALPSRVRSCAVETAGALVAGRRLACSRSKPSWRASVCCSSMTGCCRA
jgi:hypothetical protein